jgi:O-acetyl-ADP-ribose deacetylase (regulator of RNase III)
MDGGIDYVYYHYFGADIQVKVQQAIARRPEGMLPLGASLIVKTGDSKIPFLLVAPTMEMPGAVGFSHCYHAMVAILRAAHTSPQNISDVFCPGLATGVGRVAPEYAAQEMAVAYHDWNARMAGKEKRESL